MLNFINRKKYELSLWLLILAYILYFSYFTILRMRTLYASYFDLGIMHQAVYNTFQAIRTADWTRFLEITNPHGFDQVKRMAIHNDVILAPIALLYFIYSGPETLLVLQAIVLALGAIAVYKIALFCFKENKYRKLLGLIFSFSYLMYPPMQKANNFEFHAVTLSTTFLLFLFYFFLIKKYWQAMIFLVLSLLTKEQIGLTTFFFGGYFLYRSWKQKNLIGRNYSLIIMAVSILAFITSVYYIIPLFRGSRHFALSYYENLTENNPLNLIRTIFNADTLRYLFFLLGPLGFLPLISPLLFLISLPELAINLFSSSANMRNIYFHYAAVIQPFIFIAAVFGANSLIIWCKRKFHKDATVALTILLFLTTIIFAYFIGPLPFSRVKEIHPFAYPSKETGVAQLWAKTLKNENLKIMTSGHLGPLFTSRRYYYQFSVNYLLADYVVLQPEEIYNGFQSSETKPAYEEFIKDDRFELIYQQENFEVYKKK